MPMLPSNLPFSSPCPKSSEESVFSPPSSSRVRLPTTPSSFYKIVAIFDTFYSPFESSENEKGLLS
ncbi:hypothetical protein EB820_22925 [Brevibacillus agri]|uniref:Uncharacterized protein n=1 Tax=Brevibacillus agri TaxID=51101 RepID=A0A3M8AC66_9BACL|nr:hypothetical protein D478_06834 [Brevibacillus agri BAB-2500]MBG9563901.1 hypothetical protein [Brevibacillus agri]QAV15337.1 hypothetical protein BA6348_22730 [Brevibacillus agri]RNB48823.1 hypothetical protein EB820_22925 [Brevibacillus agri]